MRILSKAAYPATGLTPQQIRNLLIRFTNTSDHLFWPDSITLLDPVRFSLTGAGPKNLTGLYLLGLANQNTGCLVTFDTGLRSDSVAGCTAQSLKILTSAVR